MKLCLCAVITPFACRPPSVIEGSLLNHLLQMQRKDEEYRPPSLRLITLLLVVYVYDIDQDTFKQLPDMPPSLPVQLWNAKKALQSIEQGGLASDCCSDHSLPIISGHESFAWNMRRSMHDSGEKLSGQLIIDSLHGHRRQYKQKPNAADMDCPHNLVAGQTKQQFGCKFGVLQGNTVISTCSLPRLSGYL